MQNALASGGSFITLPSLMLTGMDARAANITSTVALFPAQLVTWGGFFRQAPPPGETHLPPWGAGVMRFFIAVYGGYFGGGIGLLMMAALTMMGLAVRNAGAAKNILAGVINASAVAIFVFSKDVHWLQALITAIGASFGGWAGALMLRRVNEKLLKLAVVALGVALTIGLFWTAP